MFWIVILSSVVLILLLGKFCPWPDSVSGFLDGWEPLSIGWKPGGTSVANPSKAILVSRLWASGVLVTSVTLSIAMYAFHRRRRLRSVRALKQPKEDPCAQRPALEPSPEEDETAAVVDVRSIASSSYGDGGRLDRGTSSATPVTGRWPRGPVRAASRAVNRSTSIATTVATSKTPSIAPIRSPYDPRGASDFTPRLDPSPDRLYLSSDNCDAIFGELLPACHQRWPAKFVQLFNSIESYGFQKIAEGKDSEVFRVSTYKGESVLKVQQLNTSPESLGRLLTTMTIASRLTELRKTQAYFTTCFVELRSVTCIFDAYPEDLLAARETPAGSAQQERRRVRQGQEERAYVAWHMSHGGVPIDQIELESAQQLFSVLQQVALSLAVAEELLEFEHRGLRLGHVLVKKTHEQKIHFSIGGCSLAVNTCGIEAHVAGYSSARISDGDTPVYTVIEDVPDDSPDRSLLCVYRHMASIIRDDWHAFHPLTNLLWVRHLTRELYRRYKPKFRSVTDRYEALAWAEIGCWRDQLLDYYRLGDFVDANFTPDSPNSLNLAEL